MEKPKKVEEWQGVYRECLMGKCRYIGSACREIATVKRGSLEGDCFETGGEKGRGREGAGGRYLPTGLRREDFYLVVSRNALPSGIEWKGIPVAVELGIDPATACRRLHCI